MRRIVRLATKNNIRSLVERHENIQHFEAKWVILSTISKRETTVTDKILFTEVHP